MPKQLSQHWIRRPRTAVCLLCILNIGFMVIGAPLPEHHAKDRSIPYPCMDHACGCMNAEQCWRGCCCCTLEEKLAWARKNGVSPPAFALAHSEVCEHEHHDCLASKYEATSECCECERTKSEKKSCCQQSRAVKDRNMEDKSPVRWMTGIMALRCQEDHGWIILACFLLINVSEMTAASVQVPLLEQVLMRDETGSSQSQLPAVPPPRL